MNIMKSQGACRLCTAYKRSSSIEMTLNYMDRELNNILLKNKLTKKDLLSYKRTLTREVPNSSTFECHLHKLCGSCTDTRYRSLKTKEKNVLYNICLFLTYMKINNIIPDNLHNLKDSCRGDYSSLYRCIENVERSIKNELNKNKKETL